MATKYECDRCGRQFDKEEEVVSLSLPQAPSMYDRSISRNYSVTKDVCVSCLRDVHKALERLPKPTSVGVEMIGGIEVTRHGS